MARLNIERQELLEPIRMKTCQEKLESLGFIVRNDGATKLTFSYNGNIISFWPYSGWHSGKGIKPGRGFAKLLKQLTA